MAHDGLRSFLHRSDPDPTQEGANNTEDIDPRRLEDGYVQHDTSSEGYSEPDWSEVENKDSPKSKVDELQKHTTSETTLGEEQDREPVLAKVKTWLTKKEPEKPAEVHYKPADLSADSSTYPSRSETPDELIENYHHHPHDDIEDQQPPAYIDEARHLVRTLTEAQTNAGYGDAGSGTYTPAIGAYISDFDYVPAPKQYKPSIFATILSSKLNSLSTDRQNQNSPKQTHTPSVLAEKNQNRPDQSYSPNSGSSTPVKKVKWYDKPEDNSAAGLLIRAAMSSTGPAVPGSVAAMPPTKHKASKSMDNLSSALDFASSRFGRNKKTDSMDSQNELVIEVADLIARRNYLTKLCGALMKTGAPTHRMEAYLAASARSLSIEADFLYMPGAMICTFIDRSILANNVEVVRKVSSLDFGRLKDVFNVYKNVIHKKFTAREGILELEKIEQRPDRHSEWFRILMFGLACVTAGPFSFNTRPIDFGPILVLGCLLGYMQIKVVPKSEQFSNVFEVFACVVIAFIARGLGSIKYASGEYIFCFSGVAQSSIAMLLPGFLVLNSALELQGKNMVSGSVRMVFAIIYVLFLGFGLLIGTTVFGLIKRDATEVVTCDVPAWFQPDQNYKLLYTRFVWAPVFACCVALLYQAKWRQLPVMALIAFAGHQANYWISTQLSSNVQVANAIGAFAIGCLANLYSRLFHGLAAAAMLPAIYCQVPGGLAASGSLVAGVVSSNQITGNSSAVSIVNNGTQGFVAAQNDPNSVYGGTIYNAGYGMVQVSIGISVGLYLSALVIYPFGKRRSGLFSF